MILKWEGKVLSAESKAYKMNGNEGISHRVRLAVDGEIYPLKSSEEQVLRMKPHVGKEGVATVDLQSRKETLAIDLIEFAPRK